jgi:hypothetical protein
MRLSDARFYTTKVPALGPVQTAEPILLEAVTVIQRRFSTSLSTSMLKSLARKNKLCEKEEPPKGGYSLHKSSKVQPATSSSNF